MQEIKDDPKRGFYCIDFDNEIDIFGNENDKNYKRLEVLLLPCNVINSEVGPLESAVEDQCLGDL